MTRVTFGVSSSSFVANMCVKQNALDFSMEHPNAAKVVRESFYVDDGLTGSEQTVELQHELQALFDKGGFLLKKWNACEPSVLQQVDPDLCDSQCTISISDPGSYHHLQQLYGFSDASERAYSGVVYLRLEDSNGNIHTSMVMAKTHVAPIKNHTTSGTLWSSRDGTDPFSMQECAQDLH